MKKRLFKGEVLSGHKDHAVEVPFNPAETWGQAARPLWRGRKGHLVSGTLNRFHFEEGFIVPRARKFFLLIDKDLQSLSGVKPGDCVRVSLTPKK